MQKTLIWIFSPPDKRKHLSSFFKKQGVTVYDIDDKIKSLPQNANQGLRDIITKNSRTTLQSFWRTAVDEVLITISNSSAHTAVMLGHLLYYKDFTKEFFSIFDTSFLIQKATEREIYTGYTVLIIDDIYDIFNSLKKPDELFGTSAFYDFLDNNFGRSISENKPDYKPHMSWIHYCLNSILNWRIQEITLGQNISNQTNSRFILWGLKQNPLVLLKLISPSPEQEILYLSHPISEPRREFKEKGEWPDLVKILNNFQRELLKKDILIQMPTSIDEYRLDKDRHGNYTTFLTPRWPLEDESKKILIENDLIDEDIDKLSIIHPGKIENQNGSFKIITSNENHQDNLAQEYMNGVITTLEMCIKEQLANRDHLLVLSTNGIIVIDPYSIKERKIHRGVQKEIEYLKQINSSLTSERRRICGIFLESMVMELINDDIFKKEYVYELATIISQDQKLKLKDVLNSLDSNGFLFSSSGSMGKQFIPNHIFTKIINNLRMYQERALATTFISVTLGLEENDEEFVLMKFVVNFELVSNTEIIEQIQSFFKSGDIDMEWKYKLKKWFNLINNPSKN